jgi:aspartate dehydrogenase
MGAVLARHLVEHWAGQAQWIGFCDYSRARAAQLASTLGQKVPIKSLSDLVDDADWIVEAASPQAASDCLEACLAKKKNLVVMSASGILPHPALLQEASRVGMRLLVPSGAIAGLDAIKAARLGDIQEVQITTTKPPRSLRGAPYLDLHRIDVDSIREKRIIFEGNAEEAGKGFPANINVAAALALVSGMGAARTKVKIIADPSIQQNVHQIYLRGSTGTITTSVENVPSVDNPKTSAIAVLAACATLDDIFSGVRVGT